MEKVTPTKAGKAIMDWAFKERLVQDIEETNKELERLYNIRYPNRGTYTKIDFLERLLMDMERLLKKSK